MKKLVILFAIILAGFIFVIYNNTKASVPENINPVESFGNQRNSQENYSDITVKEGDWIYGGDMDFSVIKFRLDNPDNQKKIYTDNEKQGTPVSISKYDGWIYFVMDMEEADIPLCRVKEDGSNKTTLLKNIGANYNYYILTDKGIYYEKNNWLGIRGLYAMNFDGSNKRKVLMKEDHLDGIDDGWIYFRKGEAYDVYRVRSDGTDSEKVLDGTEVYDDYIVEKGQMFFVYSNKKDKERKYFIKKKVNGKETTLTEVSFSNLDCSCLNKEGNWLYFADGNKVYKMNVAEKCKKKLVYSFSKNDYVESILLYDGDVITYDGLKTVCIKKDGTVINL